MVHISRTAHLRNESAAAMQPASNPSRFPKDGISPTNIRHR